MNHRTSSTVAAVLAPFALAMLIAGGCGQAFTATGATSGGGGETASAGETGVSASVAASGSGGAGGVMSTSSAASSTSTGASGCDTTGDCPDKQFCLKSGCGGGAVGACKPVAMMHVDFDPVCGCDGVTYWNSIYGAESTKPIHKLGPCGPLDKPQVCNAAGSGCSGANQHCALPRQQCSDVINEGTCWVVPDTCDGTTVGVSTCEIGNLGECRSLCSLITQGQPFLRQSTCVP